MGHQYAQQVAQMVGKTIEILKQLRLCCENSNEIKEIVRNINKHTQRKVSKQQMQNVLLTCLQNLEELIITCRLRFMLLCWKMKTRFAKIFFFALYCLLCKNERMEQWMNLHMVYETKQDF